MIVVDSAGMTDVGRKRKGNEDSIFYDDEMGLYVVADGMGGHNAGEVASKIVADTLRDQMGRFRAEKDADKLREDDPDLSLPTRHLNASIHMANSNVFEQSKRNPAQKGMGSTVSIVYLTENTMIIGNVGDSPIYLIRDGEIRLVSVLHTMMAEYEAMAPGSSKKLSEQFRHMITRAMGIDAVAKPDFSEIECRKNDTVVISSDGLTDMVEPPDILEIAGRGSAESACRALVDLANENGGQDNITVIVLKIVEVVGQAADLPAPPEKARQPKTDHAALPVNIDTEDASFSAYLYRIDTDGAFIETTDPFAVGTEIYLTVSDPDGQNPFMIVANVAKRRSQGIEVAFGSLPDKKRKLVQALMEKL